MPSSRHGPTLAFSDRVACSGSNLPVAWTRQTKRPLNVLPINTQPLVHRQVASVPVAFANHHPHFWPQFGHGTRIDRLDPRLGASTLSVEPVSSIQRNRVYIAKMAGENEKPGLLDGCSIYFVQSKSLSASLISEVCLPFTLPDARSTTS